MNSPASSLPQVSGSAESEDNLPAPSSTVLQDSGEEAIAGSDQKPRHPMQLLIFAVAATAILLVGIGVGIGWTIGSSSGHSAATESPFNAVKQKCASSSEYAKVGDEGASLTLSGRGEERSGLSYEQIECFLSELKTPDSVIAEMNATRALDGRQEGDWGNLHASWIYHPDDGLQTILTFSN